MWKKWIHQQSQIEQLIEQPFNRISILGGGSEPVGSIPTVDKNWMCCANQVVMLDESDDEPLELEVLSVHDNVEQRCVPFLHGHNNSVSDYWTRQFEIYKENGIGPLVSSSDGESNIASVEELMPSINQMYVNGPSSGRRRIVPVGFNVAAEYVDNESEPDTSVMPDLVSYSSSESEYVYSDDDYNTRFHFFDDDEDDPDGVGLLVNEITSEDSDESTSNEYELVEDLSTSISLVLRSI